MIPRTATLLSLLAAALLVIAAAPATAAIDGPDLAVTNVPFSVSVSGDGSNQPFEFVIVQDGNIVVRHTGSLPAELPGLEIPNSGDTEMRLTIAGAEPEVKPIKVVRGWMTLLPPLVAILAALLFRQVYLALFLGIWLGAAALSGSFFSGFLEVVQKFAVNALNDGDRISIAVFTLLLGGLVGLITKNGGLAGLVDTVSRWASNPRRGQTATWLLGLMIFFDDYTNTLIVGNTMRPVTDKLRISREKLAYLVDATAAPVASVAVITSWIGFEISLLRDAFATVGVDRNPFSTFVEAIPYSFYPLLTLLFVFLVANWGRDFGPMLRAERRARRDGKLLADDAQPLSKIDEDIRFDSDVTPRAWNALLPIITVVVVTVVGLLVTGQNSLGGGASWFDALREGNSFVALLWSSFLGCVVALILAVAQRAVNLNEGIDAWVSGVKTLSPAMIILVLAWAIGDICSALHTADFLVHSLSNVISPKMLPLLVFLVSAAVSFSTGTSWGTMTILTPLCVPLVIQVSTLAGLEPGLSNQLLLGSISAILSGAVFGDHCSPISDTTIMSSLASASDHIDHVRTQLPYAMVVAGTAIVTGYLLMATGLPVWIPLLVSAGVVIVVVRFVGKPVGD